MGHLTRDPELRYTPNGSAVTSFGLAVNRKYRSGDEMKEETCFVDITVWGKQAESCASYLNKGSAALIDGRLSFRTWQTDDGQKRSKLDVVALNVQFLPKSSGGETRMEPGETRMESAGGRNESPQSSSVTIEEDVPF